MTKFTQIAARYIIPTSARSGGLQLAFDAEADGLVDTATKIHCIVVIDLNSDQVYEYGPNQIDEALEHLGRADHLVGHNIAAYDLQLFKRFHGWRPKAGCIITDTLVASRQVFPNIGDLDKAAGDPPLAKLCGRHSIEAWGLRLGMSKTGTDITDFSIWTAELQARCVGDAVLCKTLYHFLQPEGQPREALELEHRAAEICDRMTVDGVPFDTAAAERLQQQWQARCEELKVVLAEQLPGTKPTSRQQIGALLVSKGWVPERRTPTGRPSVTNELLETMAQRFPELGGLGEYLLLRQRLGSLADGKEAWIKHVRSDGRIHASLLHIGQPHHRASSFIPNLHSVPNPKKGSPYGEECRALFRAPDVWVFVTADQANLQDRALAHYLHPFDGGRLAKAYAEGGEQHWPNTIALGLVPKSTVRDTASRLHTVLREGAKRFRYAFLFGAGGELLGIIIYDIVRMAREIDSACDLQRQFFGGNSRPTEAALKRVGLQAKKRFLDATPGLEALQKQLAKRVDAPGWLKALDGRRLPLRAKHTALNFLLVSAEAIICKRWLIRVYDELRERFRYGWGGDAVLVLWVHDELAVCCRPEIAGEVGEIMVRHAKEAGEHYGFKVPLDAEYKIGCSWAGEPVDDARGTAEPQPAINAGLIWSTPTLTELSCTKCRPAFVVFPDKPMKPVEAAVSFVKQGITVFPAPLNTKRSHKSEKFSNGAKWGATKNLREIRYDFGQWPNAQIGLPTGRENGIFVIEVDTKEGHDIDGAAGLAQLEAENEKLPPTLLGRSPSGSLHHYFRHPGFGIEIRNSTSKLAPGVDVRGDGGMVIAPPSRRHDGQYSWLNGFDIADPPQWLLDLIIAEEKPKAARKTHETRAPIDGFDCILPDIGEIRCALHAIDQDTDRQTWFEIGCALFTMCGEGGLALWDEWSSGKLRGVESEKYESDAIAKQWKSITEANGSYKYTAGTLFHHAHAADPDWRSKETPPSDNTANEADAEQTASDEAPKAETHTNDIDPVDLWDERRAPPLPRGLLPKVIEDFANVQGGLMGCDPAGLAAGALTCCGVAIPDCVQIQPKRFDPNWQEGPRLWVALVGQVSSMKSPMMRVITRPIRRIDAEMARAYAQAMAVYKQLDKEERRNTEEPRHTRIRIEDATPEAIQPILRDSPDGVLLERDELAAFFGGIEKYAAGRGSAGATRGFYLQAYQGGTYNWDRIARGSGFIPNLSISILGGIQPNVISSIADTGDDDGLIQRLCPIMLHGSGKDTDAPLPPATEAYEQLINRLHGMPRDFAAPLKFDDAALKVRERLAEKHLELARAFENLHNKFAAHIGKYNGLFARLCLIWHTIEHADTNAWPDVVDAKTAERVAGFMHRFLLPHAQAFYLNLLGRAEEDDRLLALAGYILVHRPEFLTARDVQRGVWTMRKLDKKNVETLFDYLNACGWVEAVPGMRVGHLTRWRVNPRVHELFANKAAEEAKRRAVAREKIKEAAQERRKESL